MSHYGKLLIGGERRLSVVKILQMLPFLQSPVDCPVVVALILSYCHSVDSLHMETCLFIAVQISLFALKNPENDKSVCVRVCHSVKLTSFWFLHSLFFMGQFLNHLKVQIGSLYV